MTLSNLTSRKAAPRIPPEVAAVLAALHLSHPDTSLLKTLGDQEWKRLLEFCDTAHLTLPLTELSMDGLPEWVVNRLMTNLLDNALRFETIKTTYREAAKALSDAGVEHIVIKGFTQAPNYVADPRLRAQSDLDFFCPPESIDDARAALVNIGYKSDEENKTLADHTSALVRPSDWQWKGNPFDAAMPLGIELHFCLWNDRVSLIRMPEVELFWERRTTRVVNGLSFPCLSPVDHVGYLTLHILRNIFLCDWIVHHVRELAIFLDSHANDDAFWQSWCETHSPSLRSLEAIAFYYAQAWFGCRLHPQAAQEIADLNVIQKSWLQTFSGSALEVMFHQNKDSVWLHLSFLSSHWDRWKILKRSLIPPRIAPVGAPIVRVRYKRLVTSNDNNPWRQYIVYLLSRSVAHGRASLSTLTNGLVWRLSQHRLSSQFWIFLAASLFFDLGLSIYFFLFNLFLLGHGYTEKSLGLLTSAIAVGNLVGAVPAGKLAQRFGLRPVLIGCFIFAVATCSARVLLLTFPWQLSLAFLAGVALSSWAVCLSPVVAQLTDEKQRPLAFSLVFSLGIGLGAVGGFAGSRLPGWFAGNHLDTSFLEPAQTVLLLACGLAVLGVWPVAKLTLTRPSISPKTRPALSPFLFRFLPAIAIWGLVTGSFSPLASVYFSRHLHMSLPQIGNAFSLSQIAQVAAVLVAPMLFRRMGLIAGIVSTQVVSSLLLLTLAMVGDPFMATATYVGFTAFQWMNEPGLYSLLMNSVPPEDRSGASASNSLVGSASQVIAASLAGGAFARYGYPYVLRIIAFIALLAAALLWTLQHRPNLEPSPALEDGIPPC